MTGNDVCMVAKFGWGAAWEELWYNRALDHFFLEAYHCGYVDSGEDHYDGTKDLTHESALKELICRGEIKAVIRFREELQVEKNWDNVSKLLYPSRGKPDLGWLADKECEYFQITEEEYAVFWKDTFYSVKKGQPGAADFSVVLRIMEHADSVTRWYCSMTGKWCGVPI